MPSQTEGAGSWPHSSPQSAGGCTRAQTRVRPPRGEHVGITPVLARPLGDASTTAIRQPLLARRGERVIPRAGGEDLLSSRSSSQIWPWPRLPLSREEGPGVAETLLCPPPAGRPWEPFRSPHLHFLVWRMKVTRVPPWGLVPGIECAKGQAIGKPPRATNDRLRRRWRTSDTQPRHGPPLDRIQAVGQRKEDLEHLSLTLGIKGHGRGLRHVSGTATSRVRGLPTPFGLPGPASCSLVLALSWG